MDQGLEFVCLSCKSVLEHTARGLRCSGCFTCYPLREGIPSFAKRDFYWNEIPRADMQRLLNVART
ncbi:hypothetical protein D6833_05500, partial [Candidatus Parcubacteria bacterium]